MGMKSLIEEWYDTREQAEYVGTELQQWLGYEFEVIEEEGRFKLVAQNDMPMMG